MFRIWEEIFFFLNSRSWWSVDDNWSLWKNHQELQIWLKEEDPDLFKFSDRLGWERSWE